MLGFAQKAGKIVSGEGGCKDAVKNGKVSLILVAKDASINTKSDIKSLCTYYNVKLIEWSTKDVIGLIIGKSPRAIVGITDKHFSKEISKLLQDELVLAENSNDT